MGWHLPNVNLLKAMLAIDAPNPQEAKKVLDLVLSQLAALENLPSSIYGKDISQKIPPLVQTLSKFLPDLQEILALKKDSKKRTEDELKSFLAIVATELNEAMEVVKMGRALLKSWCLA